VAKMRNTGWTLPGADSGEGGSIEVVSADDAWGLVEAADLGRLCLIGVDEAPDVFPMNYLARDRQIYCRTSEGGKLNLIGMNPRVAFEIDSGDSPSAWSVVIRGVAWRIDDPYDISDSGIRQLLSASPTGGDVFLRIAPLTITGRRFSSRRHRTTEPVRSRRLVGTDEA